MRVWIFFKNKPIFENIQNFLFITCLIKFFRVPFSIRNHPVTSKMVVFVSAARRPVKVVGKASIALCSPRSELRAHVFSAEYL